MSDTTTYPLSQALLALEALRNAAHLPPQEFPAAGFVGMISDEVEALRRQGKTDVEISTLIHQSSGIELSPEDLAKHYATPEQRHPPQG